MRKTPAEARETVWGTQPGTPVVPRVSSQEFPPLGSSSRSSGSAAASAPVKANRGKVPTAQDKSKLCDYDEDASAPAKGKAMPAKAKLAAAYL